MSTQTELLREAVRLLGSSIDDYDNIQEVLALKRSGWPKEKHQLLCCNCNQGKARNKGVCPHKQKDQS